MTDSLISVWIQFLFLAISVDYYSSLILYIINLRFNRIVPLITKAMKINGTQGLWITSDQTDANKLSEIVNEKNVTM